MTPEPGQLIANRYRLVRPLGEGGMGVVWAARHVDLEVEVALKFISEDDTEGAETARARFKREARAAAQLKSPHVAQIHDYGVEGSMPYIAMELLEGEDLDTLLEREGRLSLDRCTEILEQVCHGLQVAHDAAVVHRDLKPSNIFLARMGDQEVVKILDFGIAKLLGVRLPKGDRTKSGVLIGSPRYMSPEQTLGASVSPSADLWSLGMVLFEMVTGQSPFDPDALFQAAGALTGGPNPPATERVSGLPPQIDEFFERALAGNPEQRYRSAKQLAEAFKAAAAGQPLPASVRPSTKRYPVEQMVGASSDDRGPGRDSASRDDVSTRRSADMAFAATAVASSGRATTAATVPVISAASEPGRRSAVLRRPWLWVLAVAIIGAVVWLVAPQGSEQPETQSDAQAAAEETGAGEADAPQASAEDDPASAQPLTEPDASTSEVAGSSAAEPPPGSPARPPVRPTPATTKGPGAARTSPRARPTAPAPKATAPRKPVSKDSQFGI